MKLYKIYITNIYLLLKTYNFHYNWFDIDKEKFYSYYGNPQDFSNDRSNKTLLKYKDNKIGLAKELLKNGMYFPFFYFTYQNKKIILMGKHRLYSLIQLNKIQPIKQKFLFIELPAPWEVNFPLTNYCDCQYFSSQHLESYNLKIKNYKDITDLLLATGDALGPIIKDLNVKPFKPFNNEYLFEEWINQ